ncbi:MAG: hypothetical protein VW297_08605 [Paracoccaceae bacterium]
MVVDQLRDDASVKASNGDKYLFREMLSSALKNHPDQPIVIKTHPEKILGARAGYYGEDIVPKPASLFMNIPVRLGKY